MNFNEELQDSLEELSQLTISGQFNEYVLKSLRALKLVISKSVLVLAKSYSSKTLTNSNAETSIIPSDIIGSLVIPANFLTAGKILRITALNKLTTGSGQTSTLKVKLGTTELVSTTETLPNGLNDEGVDTTIVLTCFEAGETGKIQIDGFNLIHTGTGIVQSALRHYDALTTFDTTKEATLDITYKFSVASTSNTLKVDHFLIEAI